MLGSRRSWAWLSIAGVTAACSGQGNDGGGTGGGAGVTSGAVVCETDDDCRESVLAQAGPLNQSLPPLSSTGSECRARGLENHFRETVCVCGFQAPDHQLEETLGHRESCNVWGRDRTCIAEPDSFLGCDVDVADSCSAPCAALEAAYNLDRTTTHEVEVRYARCPPSGATCDTVTRIDDVCFEGELGGGWPTYDCSLSDEEILRQGEEARNGPSVVCQELDGERTCTTE